MREHGHLSEWNEDRGYGFIAPASGRAKLFVHVSAFPRQGGPPSVGEILSFEVGEGRDGRAAAKRVQRPGGAKPPMGGARPFSRPSPPPRPAVPWTGGLVLAAVAVVAVLGLREATRAGSAAGNAATPLPATRVAPVAPRFSCDGRTECPEMRSCAEARHFLRHCPGVRMDGDGDGIPCEQQWCR
ncbi:cold shock domain-containing protein [Marilutibacter aestuarii]|uniref:Cold-shock protein n=1 Tax=Marilutibacter aestuarii TaxID=1706195 RepID=A0A508AAX7_9GAMM|nr:cold shock domain-containing protein [Lysobacter aestuarii]TQD45674.1 cold-shock protein [Lysobacter aestuarii]